VQRTTADQIRRGAEWLDTQDWSGRPETRSTARALLRWEKQLMDSAIERMVVFERLAAVTDEGTRALKIDPDAVATYFRRRCGEDAGIRITRFRQAVGGRSRQTALFTLEGNTGLPRRLLIQRDHPASVNPRGVVQEFPVLRLVAEARLKVARPLFLEPSREPLGAPFIVLEQVKGTVAGPDYFNPPAVEGLALQLAAELARLHRVPFDSIRVCALRAAGRRIGLVTGSKHRAFRVLRHFHRAVSGGVLMDALERRLIRPASPSFTTMFLLFWPNSQITALLDWGSSHQSPRRGPRFAARSFPRWCPGPGSGVCGEGRARVLGSSITAACAQSFTCFTLVQYGRECSRSADRGRGRRVGASFVQLVRRLATMLVVLPA
jgi:hypothetical protein